jgi:hypothetical protein
MKKPPTVASPFSVAAYLASHESSRFPKQHLASSFVFLPKANLSFCLFLGLCEEGETCVLFRTEGVYNSIKNSFQRWLNQYLLM